VFIRNTGQRYRLCSLETLGKGTVCVR